MRKTILLAVLTSTFAATTYAAVEYPVSGKWGEAKSGDQGAVDCAGRRVIAFNGDQRTDSTGGVRAYRIQSSEQHGRDEFRIVDQFANGQVRFGRTSLTLKKLGDDRLQLDLQGGHTLMLQRCK